jgi:diguanylate cyclase (GGDEF)-like protein
MLLRQVKKLASVTPAGSSLLPIELIFFNYTDVSIDDALRILKKKNSRIFTINENDLITDCIEIFVSKGIKHLPVVNAENRVVGIISATDIIQKISYLIFIDGLTGFGNRHYFESLKVKFDKFRGKITIGILILDIDNFKKVNDTYERKVLKKVAETIISNIRFVDETVRYGGEEFLIMLFKAYREVVLRVAERVRQAVERIKFEEHPELKITISIGTTLYLPSSDTGECVKRADLALKKSQERRQKQGIFPLSG